MKKININWKTYEINEETNTAEVYKARCEFSIPSSIIFDSKEYLVNGFKEGSFYCINYDSDEIEFADDIMVSSFNKNIFRKSDFLQYFNIPQYVKTLEDGWCKSLKNMKRISISPKNTNFLCINDNMIVGKTDQNKEIFDVLIIVSRNTKNISIPSYIKHISSYCFSDCKNLNEIQFSENSELQSLGKNVFSHSSIQYLSIPSNFKHFKDGWCKYANNLNVISISPKNKNFKSINDNKIIVGKSNECSDEFDVLLFVSREIQNVKIPSYIKYISSYCFSHCNNLELIELEENSKLETIGKGCFYKTKIEHISIPSNLKELKDGWCEKTPKLVSFSISPKNKNFKNFNNKMILGKSNEKGECFDTLLFACRDIKHIKVPSYIKYISPYCFSDCQNIESIEIEENSELISLGNNSFSNSSIEHINIPKTVEKIGKSAFFSCENLKTIEFHKNSRIVSIEKKTFMKSSLQKISIPDSVSIIKKQSFSYCSQLTDVIISNSSKLELIERQSFEYSAINEIRLPSIIKQIGPKAFYFCEYLQKVDFSNDSELISIEDKAFMQTSISEIIIPKKTKIIQQLAFYSCENLQTLKFQENSELSFIGDDAFIQTSINDICIPSHVKYIGKFAFFDCKYLEKISFENNSVFDSLSSYINMCKKFDSLYIPENIKKNDLDFLMDYYSFTNIYVSPNNKYFSTIDNKMFLGKSDQNKEDFDVLIFACCDIEKIIIPSSIKQISSFCFKYCEKLKTVEFSENSQLTYIGKNWFNELSIESIKIPKHVKIIDDNAFSFCNELHSIDFEEDSELEFIGKNSFRNTLIENVTIPRNIKKIDENAFCSCNNLKSIDFSENSKLEFVGEGAFNNANIHHIKGTSFMNKFFEIKNKMIFCKSKENDECFDTLLFACRDIKHIKVPSYIKYILPYCFSNCRNIESFEIEENSELISLGNNSFLNSSIKHINIPENVKIIEKNAFSHCAQLKTIKFAKNSKLEKIGEASFISSKIECIEIPELIETIEEHTFIYCYNLHTVKFSKRSKLSKIDDRAFSNSSINSINIPANVKKIGQSAFEKCINLTTVTFAENSQLNKISPNAFRSSNIEKITIPKNVKIIEEFAFDGCINLQHFDFENGSMIEIIKPYAFRSASIQNFKVPSSLKEIREGSFFQSKLQSIEFEENSKLEFIDGGSFGDTPLYEIIIPSKAYLNQTWLSGANNLLKISVSPKNNRFKCIENSMILTKSNPTIEKYDVLYSVSNNIKHLKIPSYIKYIASNCFSYNENIKTVEFSDDSELQYIRKSAFAFSSVETIIIPAQVKQIKKIFQNCKLLNVNLVSNSQLKIIGKGDFSGSCLFIHENLKELEDGWCLNAPNLKYLTISPSNKNFLLYDDKMIIGKSNLFNGNAFDSLLFACRDIKHAKIPSYIKYISPYCFMGCKNLNSVEFEKNSNLKTIGKFAFSDTSIQKIIIPAKCNKIGESCFKSSNNLHYIEFNENSEIDFIPNNSFELTKIKNIVIPKKVHLIENDVFSGCENLRSICFLGEILIIHHHTIEQIKTTTIIEFPNALNVHLSAKEIPNIIIMVKSGALFK